MHWISRARRAVQERWPDLRPDGWTLERLQGLLEGRDPCRERLAETALAHGCAEGDPAALRVLEHEYLGPIEPVLLGFGFSASVTAEAMQEVRMTLLVDHGAGASLLQYQGRGPLAGWFRTACTRAAIRQRKREQAAARRAKHFTPSAEVDHDTSDSSESADVVERLREVLRELAPHDRDLLRRRYYGGLRLEELGRVYGVHPSTVTRWLGRIEVRIGTRLRQGMCADLRLSPATCDSILRGARNHPAFELSLVLRRSFEGAGS